MKTALAAVILCLTMGAPSQQQQQEDLGLPELHKIKTVTLSPSYGCRSDEEFRKGYEKTALFLSSYSHHRNAPDLLFWGACGTHDYFQSSAAGDESLIADLGNIPLESATAHLAFNTRNVHSFDLYSRFAMQVKVEANHTYAVLINQSDLRGLFLFTVVEYIPNEKVDLRYAVKEYQVRNVGPGSEGFATLSPSYSCRSDKDFRKGYEKTALFLLYSDHHNGPDLLFNGACGSRDYFQGSTAGDDMSLIADLGHLDRATTHLAFHTENLRSFDPSPKFASVATVEAYHTYAVLINKRNVRGLFLFTVIGYVPNKRVDLHYAIKEYQLPNMRAQSEGFDWEVKNQTDSAQK